MIYILRDRSYGWNIGIYSSIKNLKQGVDTIINQHNVSDTSRLVLIYEVWKIDTYISIIAQEDVTWDWAYVGTNARSADLSYADPLAVPARKWRDKNLIEQNWVEDNND